MPRNFYKHKLLLDENFPQRTRLPKLNERFLVKHLVGDLKKRGIKDPEVYELARKQNRLLITFNDDDFKKLATKSKRTGIIGVSTSMTYEHIDNKLTALLIKGGKQAFYGKLTILSDDTKIE